MCLAVVCVEDGLSQIQSHIQLHTVWHKILTVEKFDKSGLGKFDK